MSASSSKNGAPTRDRDVEPSLRGQLYSQLALGAKDLCAKALDPPDEGGYISQAAENYAKGALALTQAATTLLRASSPR